MPKFKLRAARAQADMTIDQVRKVLGVSKPTLISWEKGRTEPKPSQLKQLAELYNIPLEYLDPAP